MVRNNGTIDGNVTQKNGGHKKPGPKDASPKLNVYILFHQDMSQANPQIDSTLKELLKKLIYILFSEQAIFKNAMEKNPNIVDDLIHSIAAAGSKWTVENKPLKTTDSLENLDLDNQSLQDIYYWMLKGYQREKAPSQTVSIQQPMIQITEDAGDREDASDNQTEEHLHKEGTISLLDFITVNPNKSKIRVFLAPRALLTAIFGDSHIVDEIIQNRIELYHQARNQKEADSLSEQFKQKFASLALNVPETMLDFTVTATDPRNYEAL